MNETKIWTSRPSLETVETQTDDSRCEQYRH